MHLMDGELRTYLDPTALRILEKRLVSGKITPQVFKDILKQQMVKYYLQTYRHPLLKFWGTWRRSAQILPGENGGSIPHTKKNETEIHHHKRF